MMDDQKNHKPDILSCELSNDMVEIYYKNVIHDYNELKMLYPYCYLTIPPTVIPQIASIKVLAVNKNILELTHASAGDLKFDYSRKIWLEIPFNYKMEGCRVFGGKWIERSLIPSEQKHFYEFDKEKGWRFCVGVPDSFSYLDNVILENVITVDHLLTAYYDYVTGRSNEIILMEYAHGDKGIDEFKYDKYNKKGKLKRL